MEDEGKKGHYDACIMDWSLCDMRDNNGDNWPVIVGDVWSDKLNRWEDGTRIRTGIVRSMPEPPLRFGDLIRTKTSSYLLGRPSGVTIQ